MSGKNNFVFVVCGSEEHIKTLNFSIKYLRKFSKNNIIVVTDKKRNNIEIEHDNVLDIKTPEHFDHHQASIYLKTGLHKFLDLSDNYCYLDSDVIALSPKVDEIFTHFYGPVTFAADYCKMESFSPNAVNCGCSEKKAKVQKAFIDTVKKIMPEYEHNEFFHHEKGRKLFSILNVIRKNRFKRFIMFFNYLLARCFINYTFSVAENGEVFRYCRRKKGWVDLDNNLIMYNLSSLSGEIKSNSEFSFRRLKGIWVNKNGEDIFSEKCDHLADMIKQKFQIDITQKNFQHWNGGVFLFNKKSVSFLDTWHQFTMDIFNDKEWKTRDQGTLIATVWKHKLQNQKLLPKELNFITDYDNPKITFRDDIGFTNNNFKTIFRPYFIHIYHHFDNKSWDVWQGVEKTFEKK